MDKTTKVPIPKYKMDDNVVFRGEIRGCEYYIGVVLGAYYLVDDKHSAEEWMYTIAPDESIFEDNILFKY